MVEKGELPDDTIGIIAKAHQQIARENSPIENVVLDLSCNSGGMIPTAAFVLGWFLGDARVSIRNTYTGSESTMVYRADVNLDHEFDEKDTLAGRGLNLYCLTSPFSFSCDNLVPWAFKEDGRVTLLGKVTGGGACSIFNRASAWGTSFQISGPMRLSFVKNGSYYDVDRGVEPDHIIDSYDHFYNRELLTAYINSLFRCGWIGHRFPRSVTTICTLDFLGEGKASAVTTRCVSELTGGRSFSGRICNPDPRVHLGAPHDLSLHPHTPRRRKPGKQSRHRPEQPTREHSAHRGGGCRGDRKVYLLGMRICV